MLKTLPCHERLLAIDTESTFSDGPIPLGMRNEIVEIGLVEVDLNTLAVTREKAYFIRPRRWEIGTKFIDLTGITEDDIRRAKPLPDVMSELEETFGPRTTICCCWGGDAHLIAEACRAYGIKSPFRNIVDLSRLFQQIQTLK